MNLSTFESQDRQGDAHWSPASLDGEALTPTIITRTKTINSYIFERGYSFRNVRIFSSDTSFINGNIFHRWVREVFIPKVEETRASLRSCLGPFNDKAVLIMDGCSSHTVEGLEQLFAEKRIEVRFLVPHSSHLTQPLDLGIFGLCKNLIRWNSNYVIKMQAIDDVIVDDLDAQTQGRPPSPEKGKLLADFILQILKAFHQATYRENVVSAFAQAGICSRAFARDPYMVAREAFVDPARALLVVRRLGLYADQRPIPDEPHRQLKIVDLNSALQRALANEGGQQGPGVDAGSVVDAVVWRRGEVNDAECVGQQARLPAVGDAQTFTTSTPRLPAVGDAHRTGPVPTLSSRP